MALLYILLICELLTCSKVFRIQLPLKNTMYTIDLYVQYYVQFVDNPQSNMNEEWSTSVVFQLHL